MLTLHFIPPFEQFPAFSERPARLIAHITLYGINVSYYFYILWSHFSKVILTTEEVITSIFKVISATTKVILATEEVITATLKVISVTTKVILATEEVITTTLKVTSTTTKVILVTEEVNTATLKWYLPLIILCQSIKKVILVTTKVILTT